MNVMSHVIAQGSYPAPREWLEIPKIKDYSLVFPIDRSNGKVSLNHLAHWSARWERGF